jgi:hypothetical protein
MIWRFGKHQRSPRDLLVSPFQLPLNLQEWWFFVLAEDIFFATYCEPQISLILELRRTVMNTGTLQEKNHLQTGAEVPKYYLKRVHPQRWN